MSKSIFIVSKWLAPAVKAGGPAKSVDALFYELQEKGVSSCILAANKDLDGSILPISNLSDSNIFRSTTFLKIILFSLKSVYKYDILYLNDFYSVKYNLIPYFFARCFGKNIFLAPRGMLTQGALGIKSRKKIYYIKLLGFLGYFNNVGLHFTDKSEEIDYKLLDLPIHKNNFVLANISDKGGYVKQEKIEKISLKFLSRLSKKKNLHGILKALKYSKGKVQMDVYGEFDGKDYKAECEKLITELPHQVTIRFHGAYKHEDLNRIFKEPCFYILPTFNENFGHSIVEALSRGIPVLLSEYTPWQNLDENKAGKILDISDPKIMMKKIQAALEIEAAEFEEYRIGAYKYFEHQIFDKNLPNKYLKAFKIQ